MTIKLSMKILEMLSKQEQQIIFDCLCAAEKENFFSVWEFEPLFGIHRNHLSAVRAAWPEVDMQDSVVSAAVMGALNHLLYYPHGQDEHWNQYIRVEPKVVRLILEKLIASGL